MGGHLGHLLYIVLDDIEVAVEGGVIGQVAVAHAIRGSSKSWEGKRCRVDGAVGGGRIGQISLRAKPTSNLGNC